MTPGTNSNMQLAFANATPKERKQLDSWLGPKMEQLRKRHARLGAARTELEIGELKDGTDDRD